MRRASLAYLDIRTIPTACRRLTVLGVLVLSPAIPLTGLCSEAPARSGTPEPLVLESLKPFQEPSVGWEIVGDVYAEHPCGPLKDSEGTGTLLGEPSAPGALVSLLEHGDVELALEFLLEEGACAAVFLQGRYEVRLCAPACAEPPRNRLSGMIRYGDSSGVPPRLNAARSPGVWQALSLLFRAPRFDEAGERTDAARFERVVLNGVTVHRSISVPKPSRAAVLAQEAAAGPLALYGESGRAAFRNVFLGPYDRRIHASDPGPETREADAPVILVEPEREVLVLRSYVDHPRKRRHDGVFVGDPTGVHYSLDLKEAALLHLWRGPFLDMGRVWTGRGMEPDSRLLDHPRILGSHITLSGRPAVSVLADRSRPWSESTEGLRRLGYELDEGGHPTFRYLLGAVELEDRLRADLDGRALTREIRFSGATPASLWVLVADGDRIERRKGSYYSVDDQLFVEILGVVEPILRRIDGRHELIAPVRMEGKESAVRWRLVW